MTARFRPFSPRRAPDAQQQAAEQARRNHLHSQARSLLAGIPEAAPRSPMPLLLPEVQAQARAPVDRTEAIKALGLYRKSVKMRPVLSGYTPKKVWKPIIFPHAEGQTLTKLSRDVSREWVLILTSISSTSLSGGRLDGSQARNLIRIIEALRKHCYLKVDAEGNPVQVREQVVQVVNGGAFCFARLECGMSPRTFYRALKHPLAHLFIRSQKVQYIEDGTQARRNCATLLSVALFEPAIPTDLEAAYWSENVEMDEVLVVPDFNCQTDLTKGRPLQNQKQNVLCGKLTTRLKGASGQSVSGQAREDFLKWIDSAALISRAETQRDPLDFAEGTLESCIDRLRSLNPGLWEYAVQIAIHHDDQEQHAVAAVGYYKALIHLGVKRMRYWVQRLEKWRLKGQKIETPGKLLMHHLNREARKATGFNIRDLGTEAGGMLA